MEIMSDLELVLNLNIILFCFYRKFYKPPKSWCHRQKLDSKWTENGFVLHQIYKKYHDVFTSLVWIFVPEFGKLVGETSQFDT